MDFDYCGVLCILELSKRYDLVERVGAGDWTVLAEVRRTLYEAIHDEALETPFIETDEAINAYSEIVEKQLGVYMGRSAEEIRKALEVLRNNPLNSDIGGILENLLKCFNTDGEILVQQFLDLSSELLLKLPLKKEEIKGSNVLRYLIINSQQAVLELMEESSSFDEEEEVD